MDKESRASEVGLAFQETEALGRSLNRFNLAEKVVIAQDVKEVSEPANLGKEHYRKRECQGHEAAWQDQDGQGAGVASLGGRGAESQERRPELSLRPGPGALQLLQGCGFSSDRTRRHYGGLEQSWGALWGAFHRGSEWAGRGRRGACPCNPGERSWWPRARAPAQEV